MRRGSSGISVKKAGKYLDDKAAMSSIQWPSGATLLWTGRVVGEYLQDESGNGYHGWMNGPVVHRGAWGDCLCLDGVNDTVAVDTVPLVFDELSILVLVNSQSLPPAWESAGRIALDSNNYFNLTCRGIAVRPYIVIGGDSHTMACDMLMNRGFWELWQFDMSKAGAVRRMYINNVLTYEAATYPGKATANYTVAIGNKMKMLFGALAIYERVLTAAERDDIYKQLFPNRRGDLVCFEGDSLTARTDNFVCYPFQLMADHPGRYVNVAVAGQLVYTDIINDGAVTDSYQVTDGQNILCFLGGANDIANSRTAEQTETAIQTYCTARRAAGWKVILLTLLPRTGALNETHTAVAAWERANWATFADALVDIALDPKLDDPTDADYYDDGVHCTTLGYGAIADAVAIELEKLYFGGARY